MKHIVSGVAKFVVANAAVIFTIMLLPVFLVTENVSTIDQIVNYLFKNEG